MTTTAKPSAIVMATDAAIATHVLKTRRGATSHEGATIATHVLKARRATSHEGRWRGGA